uniref:Uncharacterized protein n=1 Tax=Trichobilharzia regenti TaxID=157069 RepID=A0AA85ITV5_TRIRE|nr:unnamed protein product [Trichobilharzia regenti]
MVFTFDACNHHCYTVFYSHINEDFPMDWWFVIAIICIATISILTLLLFLKYRRNWKIERIFLALLYLCELLAVGFFNTSMCLVSSD